MSPAGAAEGASGGALVREIDAAEAGRHGETLEALFRGLCGGVIVRDVFPAPAMNELAARLERREPRFPETSFPPEFHAHFLGACLDLAAPDLAAYFAVAERFERALAAAFAGIGDFGREVERVLGALGGGARVEVPRGPRGAAYTSVTVRRLETGGFIPPHCEHEQATRPPYRDLRERIRPDRMASYYVMIQPPEAGGELCVSTLRFSEIDASRIENGRTRVGDLVQSLPSLALAPRAGDMVIIDGGARFHWVAPCRGARLRWTIGGFVSPARAGDSLLIWS